MPDSLATEPPISDLAFRRLAERVDRLEAELGRVLRRGVRDEADRVLLHVLAESTVGLPFTAKKALAHASRVDAGLGAALRDATIESPGELGCWCRRMVGTRDGVTVTRLKRGWWQVNTSSHRSTDDETR